MLTDGSSIFLLKIIWNFFANAIFQYCIDFIQFDYYINI